MFYTLRFTPSQAISQSAAVNLSPSFHVHLTFCYGTRYLYGHA